MQTTNGERGREPSPRRGRWAEFRSNPRPDLLAGLTVGVMLIPQGMAYALIAGLPPIYGLYASLVPLLVYAALGTSRQLAVGPVAMVSLLVAAGVAPLAGGDVDRVIELALLLAMMVGLIQLILGLVRFGFVVALLSHPVLAGFTSAAALIIGVSQLKHLVGVALPRSHSVFETIMAAVLSFAAWNWTAVAIGGVSIAVLVLLRRVAPNWPAALLVVGAAVAASALLGLEAKGVPVVGAVPGGLPSVSVPVMDFGLMAALLPTALVISLVGFMESIAVAKVYASQNRYAVDANRELVALGAANLVGAFFQAYPTTGGFSRTAVNSQAGARTPLAAVVSAGVIGLTLLFLTPLFRGLPNAVLAAIVMVAVAGLFDWREAMTLWRSDRRDLIALVVTFATTLGLGIEIGILVGMAISIGLVIHQSAVPHTALLGRVPGTNDFRNVERFPNAETPDGVLVLRLDASLFFANADFVSARAHSAIRDHPGTQHLVLDLYAVNTIDSTGTHALERLIEDLTDFGVQTHLACAKGPLRDRLRRSGIVDLVGGSHVHSNLPEAVAAAKRGTVASAAPAVTEPPPPLVGTGGA